jgi:ketosteroid isomerase-like protein
MAIDNTAGNQSQIRELLDNLAQAVRSKNVDRVMSHYSPDMLLFDLAPPLQYRGAEACRKNLATWFELPEHGPMVKKRMYGCALPFAVAKSMANGRLCMSTNQCRFTWTAATEQRSI